MSFSDRQRKALKRNLDHRFVRTRAINGRQLSYIEGWYAISQANRIFGFDAWSRLSPAACLPVKTAAPSLLSIPPRCASRLRRTA